MNEFRLSWRKNDIEKRLLFDSKKYTRINSGLSLLMGLAISLLFYAILFPFFQKGGFPLVDMFFHGGVENRSIIPYFIIFLTSWCLAILLIKNNKIKLQQKALELNLVPNASDFVLAPHTAEDILLKMYNEVDSPQRFLLLNRIERAISNLKNIGRVSDVAEGLRAQADNDEIYMESTYNLVRNFVWAIPVLGFVGTVLGLSQAVGGFGKVVSEGADIEKLKGALGGVTSGLSVAFETTLIALIAALIVQLVMGFVKQKEEDFLDSCSDYCHVNIVSKLKTIGLNEQFQSDN